MKIDPDTVLSNLELWWLPGDGNELRRDVYFSIKSFLQVRLPESEYILEEYCAFLVLRVQIGVFPLCKDLMREALRIYKSLITAH